MNERTRKLILCFLVLVVAVAAVILILDGNKTIGPALLKEPVAMNASVKVNTENLIALMGESNGAAPDEQSVQMVNAMAAIANELSLRTTKEGGDSRTEVLLKGEPLTAFSVRTGEDGIVVAADLMKDTLLKIAPEEGLEVASLPMSLDGEELEKVEKAAEKHLEELKAALREKLGAEEKGSWTFEEKTFTARRPVEMPARDAAVLLTTFVRDLLADEDVAPLAAMLGESLKLEDLDKSIEALKETPEDQLPAYTAFCYSGSGKDMYTDIAVTDQGGNEVDGGFGTVDGKTVIRLNVPGSAEIHLNAEPDGSKYTLGAVMTDSATTVAIDAGGTTEKSGESTGTALVTVNGKELLTLDYSLGSGESFTADFEAEGKKVIEVEDFSRFGQTEDTAALYSKLTSGVIGLIQDISRIMPEESNQLMTLVMTLVMSPRNIYY